MAMTVSELQVKVTADVSDAERGISSLGSKVGSAGGAIATAFGGVAIAGIAALAGGLAASTVAAAGFDQTMASVRSKLSTAEWDEQGAAIEATAKRLGRDYPLSASEAGQAIDLLVQKGVSAKNVTEGWADSVVKLSTATGSDLVTSAGIAAAASDVFGISADKSGEVVNKVTGAVLKGGMSIDDYGFGMRAAAGVVALAGGTIDDLNVGLAVMARRGVEGSDAGTSLKTMYMNLIPTTKAQIATAQELGIVTADGTNKFFDATGKVKDYAAISHVLADATSGLTEQQKLMALETLFGSDAIRAAAFAADAGKGSVDELAASINSVDAGEVAKQRLDNLSSSVESLGGSLETAGIEIGQKFTPGLKTIVDGAIEVVNQATPMLAEFAATASANITEASRQIQDAWRTAKQAFAGEWAPSSQIDPFVNAVGEAAIKVRDLGDAGQIAGRKLAEMGAADAFGKALETAAREAGNLNTELAGLGGSLENLHGAFGGTEGEATLLAAAMKNFAGSLEVMVTMAAEALDALLSLGRAADDFAGVTVSLARALGDIAMGDLPAARDAIKDGDAAMADLIVTGEEFASRTGQRISTVFATIAGDAQTGSAAVSAAVETGMAAAAGAIDDGSLAMQASMQSGMTGVVGAVEAQSPAAVAAAEGMGTGMAAGIEAAAPQMAAAAESGAGSAVAAVQGQTGAASGAGQSLGQALGSGLEGGIMAYVGRVASAAAQLVSAAIGAARGAADAQSPSRKTKKLGEDLAEGLEVGLNSSNLGEDMKAKIRDFIEASRAYIPVAGEIARIEDEIKQIRDQGQTDALFRTQEMITLDSETLRLKENITRLDRDSIGFRQDLARATREIADIERGSLVQRTENIQLDDQRKRIRLEMLDLEQKILTIEKNTERTESIKRQIEALRDQDRLLSIEQERLTTTQSIEATGARIRREQMDDQVRGYDTIIQTIKDQIETLGAERAVFDANEAVIKNATQNEIDYRNRLIAVFKSEATPLTDRIAAGLALIDQLQKEGAISKELAAALREEAKQAGAAAAANGGLASSAQAATPQIGAAATQADRMTQSALAMAEAQRKATTQTNALADALGRLPSWFTSTGGGGNQGTSHYASGGRPTVGVPSIVGERGRELFVPDRPGTILPADVTRSLTGGGSGRGASQVIRLDVAIGGKVAKQIVIEGYDLAVRQGWTAGGLTG